MDTVDAIQVADYKAVESPLGAQQVGKQRLAAGAGDTIQRVIAGHHRQGAGIDGFLEWGQETLLQLACTGNGDTAILSGLGGAVADEMLQCGSRILLW